MSLVLASMASMLLVLFQSNAEQIDNQIPEKPGLTRSTTTTTTAVSLQSTLIQGSTSWSDDYMFKSSQSQRWTITPEPEIVTSVTITEPGSGPSSSNTFSRKWHGPYTTYLYNTGIDTQSAKGIRVLRRSFKCSESSLLTVSFMGATYGITSSDSVRLSVRYDGHDAFSVSSDSYDPRVWNDVPSDLSNIPSADINSDTSSTWSRFMLNSQDIFEVDAQVPFYVLFHFFINTEGAYFALGDISITCNALVTDPPLATKPITTESTTDESTTTTTTASTTAKISSTTSATSTTTENPTASSTTTTTSTENINEGQVVEDITTTEEEETDANESQQDDSQELVSDILASNVSGNAMYIIIGCALFCVFLCSIIFIFCRKKREHSLKNIAVQLEFKSTEEDITAEENTEVAEEPQAKMPKKRVTLQLAWSSHQSNIFAVDFDHDDIQPLSANVAGFASTLENIGAVNGVLMDDVVCDMYEGGNITKGGDDDDDDNDVIIGMPAITKGADDDCVDEDSYVPPPPKPPTNVYDDDGALIAAPETTGGKGEVNSGHISDSEENVPSPPAPPVTADDSDSLAVPQNTNGTLGGTNGEH